MFRSNRTVRMSLGLSIAILACSPEPVVVDRAPADRTPLSAACDELDPNRCLLPWPSNTFTVVDPSTPTGLRVQVGNEAINPRDDTSSLSLADGFSRVTPLLAQFQAPLDESTLRGGIQLLLSQPGHPDRGRAVPLRIETLSLEDGQTLLLADPLEILEPAADYVVVVTDALERTDGAPTVRPRTVELALGAALPETQPEADLVGHHAPTRALLEEVGVSPERVRRVWTFTTRSAELTRAPLESMRQAARDAVDAEEVQVAIDSVETSDDPNIAAIVVGRLTGVPTFLRNDGGFDAGPDGLPRALGSGEAPFRVLLPAVSEDYRFVMYGHGSGGNQLDDAFDAELAALGIAKVGVRIYGWTDTSVLTTFAGLREPMHGTFTATSFLMEAVAHASAIQRAVSGALGDALSADTLGGEPNPLAGLRPDTSTPVWVGGSLGGAVGLTYASAAEDVRYAVLNVPAAAFSQWLWHSNTVGLVLPVIRIPRQDDIDLNIALSIAQTNLDLADGTSWADVLERAPTSFLIQESMGDNILPNPGTEMVAIATGAAQVGGVFEPIAGLSTAEEVVEGSGITQFRAPAGGPFDIHGFAALNNPAGDAARQQISAFLMSVFEGESRIVPPSACPEGCDYAGE
ncbi:MAG: hypothetical protein AB8I08_40885 [Sandaracinaceae bacterium]